VISLKAVNISKTYADHLLEGVDLSHSGKGIVAFIGDNGSGKSTFLKMLSGQEIPDTGTIEWSGVDSVGSMPQEIVSDESLSGGQKKIAVLADLLFSNQHDVLLLDEPDNHLDLDAKIWLEEYLPAFNGLIIMISHDRTLLEKVSTHTWLVEDHKIRTFPFGYKKFREVYEKEQEDLLHKYKTQLAEKKRLEEMAEMFHRKSLIGAYRNTQKRLERHVSEMVANPVAKKASIAIQSKMETKIIKKKTAILITDLVFGYNPKELLFDHANLHLYVQDKVALLSPNGTGKSTLVKLLLHDHLTPISGTAKIGEGLKVGYYSQDHADRLPLDETPMQLFTKRYSLHDYQVDNILRRFFFTKNHIKSQIRTLSGGQKSRLQLALFLYQNPDLLILDEPTNHLDLKSIAALENFLIEYPGTILLISHDRELLNKVCTSTYKIKNKKFIPV